MRAIHGWFLAGLVFLGFATPVQADAIYRFAFDQPSYAVAPGATVDVPVYLQEVVSGSDTSRLATDGLIGAGVRLSVTGASATSTPAQILSFADIIPNSLAFDASSLTTKDLTSNISAGLNEAVDVTSPAVLGSLVAPQTYQILLGRFRLTVGPTGGDITNLVASEFSTSGSYTVTGAGLALDSSIHEGTASINAAAVPEPGTIIIVGLALVGAVGYRWSRRKAQS